MGMIAQLDDVLARDCPAVTKANRSVTRGACLAGPELLDWAEYREVANE